MFRTGQFSDFEWFVNMCEFGFSFVFVFRVSAAIDVLTLVNDSGERVSKIVKSR